MTSKEIKELIRRNGLMQWSIAQVIGISESTLVRWLRDPVSSDHESMVIDAIEELKKQTGINSLYDVPL